MQAFGRRGAVTEGFNVTVTRSDVAAFKRQWPCSGLPDCGVTFYFAANGDLVDITSKVGSASWDGEAAVALSNDAQCYGAKRLRRPDAHAADCRCKGD